MLGHCTFTKSKELGEYQAPSSISLYLPTGIQGVDADKKRLEIKNLITHLLKLEDTAIDEYCRSKLKALDPEVESIGTYGEGTKIYFISRDFYHHIEVPTVLEPLAKVSDRFYLIPLLQIWSLERPHHLLKLSMNQVDLFLVTGLRFEKIQFKIPRNLQEYYGPDMDAWSLKKFNRIRDTYFQSNKADLMQQGSDRFYGTSKVDKHDIRAAELNYFLKHIDSCLLETIDDKTIPLMIAADEHVARQYHEISQYPVIQSEVIRGNPDHLSSRELHQKVVEAIKNTVDRMSQVLLEEYADLGKSSHAVDDLAKLEIAASSGVIKTLLLSHELHQNTLEKEALNSADRLKKLNFYEKINRIATQTLTHGGQIHWFQHGVLPTKSPAAAVLHTTI